MKRLIALLDRIVGPCVLFGCVLCADTRAFEGLEEEDGRVVVADPSKAALWEVSGPGVTAHFGEKTPEGEAAISYEVSGDGKAKCRPSLITGNAKWREKKFHGISLWVKGDGSGAWIQFRLMTGKTLFPIRFRLFHKGWKQMSFPITDLTNKAGDRFDLSKLTFLYFQSTQKLKVSYGPVRLEPGQPQYMILAPVATARAVPADKPPIINGKLDEPCWQSAPSHWLDSGLRSGKPPQERTEFKVLYDEDNVYVGAILDCADTSKLRANIKQDGSDVWQDDCLEFLFNPNNDMTTLVHLMVNSLGTRGAIRRAYDKVKDNYVIDSNWSPAWTVRCALEPTKWYVEATVPLSELGLKAGLRGKRVAFQVGRENHTRGETPSFSLTSKFPRISQFGVLTFGQDAKPPWDLGDVTCQKDALGKFKAIGMVTSEQPRANDMNVFAEITNAARQTFTGTAKVKVTARANRFSADIAYPAEADGLHRLDVCVSDGRDVTWKSFTFLHELPVKLVYGETVINPQPKKLKSADGFLTLPDGCRISVLKGASKRTEKTARFLADELYGYFGRRFAVEKVGRLPEGGGIVMTLAHEVPAGRVPGKWKSETNSLPPAGYGLAVTDRGITLKGADEAGLYYAGVTLMQVIKSPMQITQQPRVRRTAIYDWPDLQYRYYSENLHLGRRRKDNPSNVEWYKAYVKRVVAGHKFNVLSLQINSQFLYEHNPKLSHGSAFMSRKDYQELAALCAEHFVEFIPALQTGGHFWPPRSAYPQLYEEGFPRSANVTHPDFWMIIKPCMDELIEGTGAKYFNALHDEWWSNPGEGITPELNGVPRTQVFLNHVLKQHAFLKAKGLRMVMHADMLLKNHNGNPPGGPRKNLHTVAEKLPKDIIMSNWSFGVDPDSNKILHDMGFDVICASNGFRACPHDRNILKGFGVLSYGTGRLMAGIVSDSHALQYGHTAVLRSADYAWNLKVDPGTSVQEFERRKAGNITAIGSVWPNPAAGVGLEPVAIRKAANASVRQITQTDLVDLPSGKSEFGFIPMEMISPVENNGNTIIALSAAKKPVDVSVTRKASAIYFMHGFHTTPSRRESLYKRWPSYIAGVPVAAYVVTYDDGSSEEVDVRFGLHILDIIPPLPRCRFMSEVRYTWQGKTSANRPAFVYQIEWVNPHPEKKIAKISLRSVAPEVVPIIFAITLRQVQI